MQEHVRAALLIWDDTSQNILERVASNPYGTEVEAIRDSDVLASPGTCLGAGKHILLAVDSSILSQMLDLARTHGCSVGFLPATSDKKLLKRLELTADFDSNLEIALRANPTPISLLMVNGNVVFSDMIVGSISMISNARRSKHQNHLSRIIWGIRQFFTIRLQRVEIETARGKRIVTAMGGLAVINHKPGIVLTRLGNIGFSQRENQVTLIIVSPFSVYEYIKTALFILFPMAKKNLPKSLGFVKSDVIRIKPFMSNWGRQEYGQKLRAPFECRMVQDALRINAPDSYWEANEIIRSVNEKVKTENLPDERETLKYQNEGIPLFPYASENRFKNLFMELRKDAIADSIYITLMMLSTLLATIGLFANSSAVVIGAMLLAPLMAPIVSFSMGLLRGDEHLFYASLKKIGVGVLMALVASSFVTYILPDTTLTTQIEARINPTLLDLFVAILSGIAAAYSKSFREVIQSLAGVAIAVALVPPLATAGIGIGRGEWVIFVQAFLLFCTNFVGITLSATLTFYVLGYSSVFKSKRSFLAITVVMLAISFPLYHSYKQIMQSHNIAKALSKERFLVNGKYIIVRDTVVSNEGNVLRLNLKLVSRTTLERGDLNALKNKMQRRFGKKLDIHAQIDYIL